MFDFHDLPALRGAYVLHLSVASVQQITVGRLGKQQLPIGDYFYSGSARGAGGLQARLGRHLCSGGVLHWHIDYLLAVAEVRDVFYTVTERALECEWSQALAQLPAAFIPVSHFGSSDCRSGCRAHLVTLPRRADIARVPRLLAQTTSTPIVSLHFR